ncbi:hypothetical protein C1H46_022820 [Malus baccata]|uniref:Uncharacterized protein n=1 Tax=Malus baccata TaxID=106549 RepID=A0A540LYR7_MALBA|nr:hypothetical protein C1H46_022820 [Malus baccata]
MTTSTTPSSLVLTYASSYAHPQDLTPSLVSFRPKPLFKTFCLCPLALRPREIKPSKWANSEPHRVPAAALTAEADVAEDVDENKEVKGGDGSAAVAVSSKPKKGKAALLLKRDRVSLFLVFCFKFGFFIALGVTFDFLGYLVDKVQKILGNSEIEGNQKRVRAAAAIALLKEMTNTKFVETAEAHFRLNIDPKYINQQLRATASFLILLVRYMFSYQCLALYYILSLIVEFFY